MTDPRRLDYCAVRSLCGRDAADETFGRHIPAGIDMDQPGDEESVTSIVREAARCDTCSDRALCHD